MHPGDPCPGAGMLFILDGFCAGIRRRFSLGCLRLFSGRGEIPHRRYPDLTRGARERPTPVCRGGVSRSGEMPEPTVIVRMKEDKTDIAGKPHGPAAAYLSLSAFPCPDSGPCLV